MDFAQHHLLRIACWGNSDYVQHVSNEVDECVEVKFFGHALEYVQQAKGFPADVFMIVARVGPSGLVPSGVNTMLNLRALFDCRQPALLCSFEGIRLLSGKVDLLPWFSSKGPYIHLRLPISIADLMDAVSRSTPCSSTLEIKPMLLDADFFRRIKHDLAHERNARLIRIYKSTLTRYGERE